MEGEKEEGQDVKNSIAFCLQAEHAGTRTYYFSTDSLEDRVEWVQAMSEAAKVHISPPTRYMHTPRLATICTCASCTFLLYMESAILPAFKMNLNFRLHCVVSIALYCVDFLSFLTL